MASMNPKPKASAKPKATTAKRQPAKRKATKRKATKPKAAPKVVVIENRITTPRRAELGYTPTQLPVEIRDQHATEADRQAALTRERDIHNQRTGDGSRSSWG